MSDYGFSRRACTFAAITTLFVVSLGRAALAAADGSVEISASDESVVASPYNWAPDANGTGALKAWNPGAYLRFAVQGASSVTLRVDPHNTQGFYRYAVDSDATSTAAQPSGSGEIVIPLADTNRHELWVYLISIPESAGRWDGTLFFGVYGITLPKGGKRARAMRHKKNILIFGDSITEGIAAKDGTNDNQYDYSFYVGQQFLRLGYEYGIVACGSSGYTTIGAGSVPNAFKPGDDANSWWNKVNATTPRVVNGLMVPQPDIIVDNWGANDGLQGHLGPGLVSVIVDLWKALRTAAPAAKIVKIMAFGGYAKAEVNAAYATYGNADANFRLVDLNIVNRQGLYGGLHPGIWGHASIAPLVAGEIIDFVGVSPAHGGGQRSK